MGKDLCFAKQSLGKCKYFTAMHNGNFVAIIEKKIVS